MYSIPPTYSVPPSYTRHATIGSLLGETFRLYKSNAPLFIVLALLATVPPLLVNLAFGQVQQSGLAQIFMTSAAAASSLTAVVVSALAQALASIIATGGMTLAVRDLHTGQQTTLGSIVARLVPQLPALIVSALGIGLAMAVPTILAILISPILMLVVGLPLLVFVIIRLMFWVQAILLDGCSAGNVWARTLELTRGAFWRLLILTICVAICVAIMAALIGGVVAGIMFSVAGLGMATIIVTSLATAVLTPISTISQVVLYYDQRHEKQAMQAPTY